MRVIKFRVWDNKLKKMHYPYGDWIIQPEYDYLDFPLTPPVETGGDERYELMQYTGLKDHNGNDIYESDIITFHGFNNITWKKPDDGICEVKWMKETGFYPFNSGMQNSSSCDVMGNIYEDPQLLKKFVKK